MESGFSWVKERWKAILAFAGLVFTALTFYLKSKSQKKILQKANESHKKETKVNQEASDKITHGVETIRKEQVKKIENTVKEQDKKEQALQTKKEEFIKESEKDEDLAKKIADSIGADFVNKD